MKLMRKWALLAPLYEDLDRVKLEIIDNREQFGDTITQLRELEHGVLNGNEMSRDDDEWEFMDAPWTPSQLRRASRNLKAICSEIRRNMPDLSMSDIVIGKARDAIDWTRVSKGTEHEADDTKVRITSMQKKNQNQIKKLSKVKKVTESSQKSLEANRKLCVGMISKADVRTADSWRQVKLMGPHPRHQL